MEAVVTTSRKSGMTFEAVYNAHFAMSHAERTELSEPGYLLPELFRLPNFKVFKIGTEDDIAKRFKERKDNMSSQAKRANASPFWEAVVVLEEFKAGMDVNDYHQRNKIKLLDLKDRFEKETGCTVLSIDIHLDEGVIGSDGEPNLNEHAHFLIDRTIDKTMVRERKRDKTKTRTNKTSTAVMWSPGRSELAAIQTLCAECVGLTRGSTHAERGGKPARKHVGHRQWREQQDALKAQEAELGMANMAHTRYVVQRIKSVAANEADAAQLQAKDEIARAKDQAASVQAKLDASEQAVEDLRAELEISKKTADGLRQERDTLAVELSQAQLDAAYKAVRAFFKGTGQAKQADYQALKLMYEEKHKLLVSWAKYIEVTAEPDVQELFWALRGHDLTVLRQTYAPAKETLTGRYEASELPSNFGLSLLRRWQVEGRDFYIRPDAPAGQRLAFEDKGDVIDVRVNDIDDVLLRALYLAAQKWPDGIVLTGSAKFIERATRLAGTVEGVRILPPDDNDYEPS